MAVCFVDSSALVKRYVKETGTAGVRRLTRRGAPNDIYVARIALAVAPSQANPLNEQEPAAFSFTCTYLASEMRKKSLALG